MNNMNSYIKFFLFGFIIMYIFRQFYKSLGTEKYDAIFDFDMGCSHSTFKTNVKKDLSLKSKYFMLKRTLNYHFNLIDIKKLERKGNIPVPDLLNSITETTIVVLKKTIESVGQNDQNFVNINKDILYKFVENIHREYLVMKMKLGFCKNKNFKHNKATNRANKNRDFIFMTVFTLLIQFLDIVDKLTFNSASEHIYRSVFTTIEQYSEKAMEKSDTIVTVICFYDSKQHPLKKVLCSIIETIKSKSRLPEEFSFSVSFDRILTKMIYMIIGLNFTDFSKLLEGVFDILDVTSAYSDFKEIFYLLKNAKCTIIFTLKHNTFHDLIRDVFDVHFDSVFTSNKINVDNFLHFFEKFYTFLSLYIRNMGIIFNSFNDSSSKPVKELVRDFSIWIKNQKKLKVKELQDSQLQINKFINYLVDDQVINFLNIIMLSKNDIFNDIKNTEKVEIKNKRNGKNNLDKNPNARRTLSYNKKIGTKHNIHTTPITNRSKYELQFEKTPIISQEINKRSVFIYRIVIL